MNKKNISKLSIGTVLAVAAVAFTTHCGAGFAAGTQEVVYYVSKGYWGVLLPILAFGILTILYYVTAETARLNKVYDYHGVTKYAYAPVGMLGSVLFEIAVIAGILSGTAAVIAGGGLILNSALGLDSSNIIGSIIVAAIVVVITIYGVKAVNASASIMAIVIISIVMIIAILGIAVRSDVIVQQWNDKILYATTPAMIWAAITYGGFQTVGQAMVVSSTVDNFKSKRESKALAIFCFILNVCMLLLVCFMLQGFMPTVKDNADAAALPTIYAVSQLKLIEGWGWIGTLYPILYFLAAITTGVGLVFSFTKRCLHIMFKKMQSIKLKSALISSGTIILCWILAQIGLVNIIKYAYKYLGIYSIFTITIPMSILGLRNIKLKRKALEAAENSQK
jgi:uncharacterized membrane protein YkvI